MMGAAELQALLRFLTTDAKVPLATAIGKVKDLQAANLDSADKLAKAKPSDISSMFDEEKVAKQIIAAAKRVAKKRAAGEPDSTPRKKRKDVGSLFSEDVVSPMELEASLTLPTSSVDEAELSATVLFTNRAPLVLAFAVSLLKYTMPEQPLSSRLSLAQAYVSTTSRARAVNLGIESGKSAEEEGFGEGQPIVKIMGKELRVLRRWGYEWREAKEEQESSTAATLKSNIQLDTNDEEAPAETAPIQAEEQPALWALDLEVLKKSNSTGPIVGNVQTGNHSNLPIYTPQSARAYIMKSFDSPPDAGSAASSSTKKVSAAAKAAEKEGNLGKLLRALDFLYASWDGVLDADELDKRTWNWYVKVRPDVANGVAGWGGKNEVKLAEILALRRET